MRTLSASTLALALSLAIAAPPARGALVNSLRDGSWYCDFPSPNCAFDAAVPGFNDQVRINHTVYYQGQGTTQPPPLLTQVDSIQIPAGGILSITDSRALWTTGTSTFEGGRMESLTNGGGTYENRGTVNVSSSSGVTLLGTVGTNRGLWRVLTGAHFQVSTGGSTGFYNSSGAGGTAVLELQGASTLLMSDSGPFYNLGILRKTGAGTANLHGDVRNIVDGVVVDGGTIDIVQGELLVHRLPPPSVIFGQLRAVDGIRLAVASGAQLRIGNGGQYRMSTSTGGTVTHDLSGGGKFVLDPGSELLTDGSGVFILDFEPGEFEFRGGAIYGSSLRNTGTITVTGGGAPAFHGLTNAGSILIGTSQALQLNGALNNQLAGTIELQDGASLNGSNVFNQGVVVKRGGAGTGRIVDSAYDNRGSPGMLVAQSGTLERRGGSDGVIGTVWAMQGGSYRRANSGGDIGGEWCMPGGCAILGAGIFDASNLLLQGRIEPGDEGIGQLTMTGTLQMQPDAVLRFEIGGTAAAQMDRLVVPGFIANTSPGTLVARFVGGFDPRSGQRYPLIQTATPPQVLPNLQYEGLHPGFAAHLEYNGGFIELVADNDGVNLDTLLRNGFEGP